MPRDLGLPVERCSGGLTARGQLEGVLPTSEMIQSGEWKLLKTAGPHFKETHMDACHNRGDSIVKEQ